MTEEAATVWDTLTNGGKQHIDYEEGTYYDIFPATTTMVFSNGFGEI